MSAWVEEDAGSEQSGRLVAAVLDAAVPRAPYVRGRWVSGVCSPRSVCPGGFPLNGSLIL